MRCDLVRRDWVIRDIGNDDREVVVRHIAALATLNLFLFEDVTIDVSGQWWRLHLSVSLGNALFQGQGILYLDYQILFICRFFVYVRYINTLSRLFHCNKSGVYHLVKRIISSRAHNKLSSLA